MDNIVNLEIIRVNYKRYKLYAEGICTGRIVLECYNGTWNLELMNVCPTGKWYGSIFLTKVLDTENLKAESMTVCPVNIESARFFRRHGFDV